MSGLIGVFNWVRRDDLHLDVGAGGELVGDLLKREALRLGHFQEDEHREDDHHHEEQKEGVLFQSFLDTTTKEQDVTS